MNDGGHAKRIDDTSIRRQLMPEGTPGALIDTSNRRRQG